MIMNKLFRIIAFGAVVVLTSCASSKQTVSSVSINPLSETSSINDGSLVYALPRTVFTVRVKMEHTIEIPGPYAQYAADLLGLKNAIKSEQEHWSVTGITVNSHEEIDPSELYVMESNTSMVANMIVLKDEGFVLDLNPAQNAIAKVFTGDSEINVNNFVSLDLGSDEYYYTQVDTAYRSLNIDSTFINVPYVVEKKKQLTTAQLAERAAKRLIEIRDGKILILTGEANVFPQSDASIKELNKMEKEYTELFVGKTYTETRYYSLFFIPEKDMSGQSVNIFNFSEMRGVEDETSTTGVPVSITLVPEQKLKDITVVSHQTTSSDEGQQVDKVFYRIPDVVNVLIDLDGEVIYNSRKLIYQFGEIMQLPANYVIGK